MNQNNNEEMEFLKNYDAGKYERPSATVDMLIFTIGEKKKSYRKLPQKNLELLMVRRGDHPYKDMWAIPGGFVNIDENLIDSAKRELLEETGLRNIYMEQLYTWGDVGRDPRTRVISTSYMALVPKDKLDFKAGDDAADAKLFTAKLVELYSDEKEDRIDTVYELILRNEESDITLTSKILSVKRMVGASVEENLEIIESQLAFDHSKIIAYAINRLRNKVEYTTIAFNMIGEKFTIGELQEVYSALLDQEFSSPNFRRKMLPLLEELETTETKYGHRPAKHYKLSKEAAFRPFIIPDNKEDED